MKPRIQVVLDFETYYNSSKKKDEKFTLKGMTTLEYVTDPRFHVHLAGLKVNNGETRCYSGNDLIILLNQLFSNYSVHLIAHNMAFDGFILYHIYGHVADYYTCTQDVYRMIALHKSQSLDAMCIALWPNDETMRKGDELPISDGKRELAINEYELLADYCIQDCELTYAAFQYFRTFFPRDEFDIIDITQKMWCAPKLVGNRERLLTHQVEVEDNRASAIQAALEYMGTDNEKMLSSNQQFRAYLESQDIVVPMKASSSVKKGRTEAFAKNDLGFQQLQAQHPEMQAVWQGRIASKSNHEITRTKRFLFMEERLNGTMAVPLRYAGTQTKLWAGAEKLNMQNLTRGSELRYSLYAPEGSTVHVRDLSQIQARMCATVAGQEDLREQFANGEDVYSIMASEIYGRPIDRNRSVEDADGNITYPDAQEGMVGKVAVLQFQFGCGAATAQRNFAVGMFGPPVHFTVDETQSMVNVYRTRNWAIKRFWEKCSSYIRDMCYPETDYQDGVIRIQHERIVLPNGMNLHYPDISQIDHPDAWNDFHYWNGKFYTKIYSGLLCQNIVAALSRIVITDQMLAAYRHPDLQNCQIVLQVHDEVALVGPLDEAERNEAILTDIFSQPPNWLPKLPVASSGGYADNYSK